LLAEDSPDTRRLTILYLQDAALSVEVAHNGREAVQMVQSASAAGSPYDLVLMDMQMPEGDGYTATRQLRGLGLSELPIIAFADISRLAKSIEVLLAGGVQLDAAMPQVLELIELVRSVAGYQRTGEVTSSVAA